MDKKKEAAYKQALREKQHELVGAIARMEQERRKDQKVEVEDYGDKAESTYAKEAMFQQIDADRVLLTEVEDALRRIEAGEFGKCVECGRDIEAKRLQAVPWAAHCIACERRPRAEMV